MILSIIGFLLGMAIFSFTIIQAGIVVFFGIPTTSRLNKEKLLKKPNFIQKSNFISLLVWGVTYGIAFLLIKYLSEELFKGFITGSIWIMILGIGRLGANSSNVSDYINSNTKFIPEGATVDDIVKFIMKK
jgi:MFS superfamily sulfate permease-like transporter